MSAENSEAEPERSTQDAPHVPDHDLIRPIGQGSYGTVWLARNALGVFRAVKVVYLDQFDDSRPFQREYEGLGLFEPVSRAHEGLVDILHLGRNGANGSFYYVMEAADDVSTGQQIDPSTYQPRTLEQEIRRRGRLPVSECLAIASALADALDYLHTSKLVHRDVKPSNIIFVGGVPKLADVGLVAQAGSGRSYVGTEGFVPPEGPGSPQADLYSLGKVIYEMSMGKDRQAFPSPPTQLAELPERLELRELNDILTRACEPEPRRRYQTARELRADLELLRKGGQPSRERRKRKLVKMARGAAVAGVLLATFAAGLHFLRPTVLHEVGRLTRPEVTDWSEAKQGDYNDDGETDVFVAARDQVFITSAQGEFLTSWTMPNYSGGLFRVNMLADLNGDHKDEIFLSWQDSRTNLNVGVYNQNFHELKRFRASGGLLETPHGPLGDSNLGAFAVADLRQDGRRQLLAVLGTGRAKAPRGICCFDFETRQALWTFFTAPFVIQPMLVDLNRDGLLDIVFGSQAAGNRSQLNDGTDDSHSYLYAVSGTGEALWRTNTGGIFTTCRPVLVETNADGTGRVFALFIAGQELSDERPAILQFDFAGNLRARYDPGALCPTVLPAHLASDRSLDILATDRRGRLHVLDSALRPMRVVPLVPQRFQGTNHWVDLVLDTVTDLNGDGEPEVVLHSSQVQNRSEPNPGRPLDETMVRFHHDNQALVLDSKLRLLASYQVADLYKRGPVSKILPVNLSHQGRRGLLLLGPQAIRLELARAWGKRRITINNDRIMKGSIP